MNKVQAIRILPNSKEEIENFKSFIEEKMVDRNGRYYFTGNMMRCPINTLVLFQYDGQIRAFGILIERKKEICYEDGEQYAGYYDFDVDQLHYLKTPIDKDQMQKAYPLFKGFNQSMQNISMEYIDDIIDLLNKAQKLQEENKR